MLSPTIHLNDGLALPQLGLGCAFMGEQTASMVRTAIELGYRHFDTAKAYGNEAEVGEGVRTGGVPRSEITVTSKLFCEEQGYEAALAGFDAALKRMKLDYLDLYLIHWPNPGIDRYVETWRALIKLKDEGRIKSLGVSNFEPEHIDRLTKETGVTPALNQVELNPHCQQRALRAAMEKRGVVTESWAPLGHGMLLKEPVFAAIARKHGRTPAQIIVRWHIQSGIVAIPKAETREWMEQNLAAFSFALDDDDMRQLGALDQGEAGRKGPKPSSTPKQREEQVGAMLAALAAEQASHT